MIGFIVMKDGKMVVVRDAIFGRMIEVFLSADDARISALGTEGATVREVVLAEKA